MREGVRLTAAPLRVTCDRVRFIAVCKLIPVLMLLAGVGASVTLAGVSTVEDTKFSVNGGFHEEPFLLEITTETVGAEIYFTLDGSIPSPTSGVLYEQPLNIGGTTVVRAAAFRTGMTPTDVDTQTYLFLEDVIRQPVEVAGWPRPELSIGQGSRRHDYEMDPQIVFLSSTPDQVKESLLSIPSLSLVLPLSDIWDSDGEGGFYRGNLEVPVSMEILHLDQPGKNQRINAGIQGHSHDRMKRSLRLKFKAEYGAAKLESDLLREAPLNGDSAPDRFDRLILRAGNNRSWARSWNPDRTAYTMDQWYRDTQIAMSGIGSHGTFVHVYLNGLYWGMYNVVERPDTWFSSEHLGGDEDDWFAISHGGEQGGEPDRWNHLVEVLAEEDLGGAGGLEVLEEYLDVNTFADYLLLSWYINVTDWPQNNWWAGIRNNPPGQARFYAWDGEWSFGLGASPGRAWIPPQFASTAGGGTLPLTRLWHAARGNEDFMMCFADRAHLHLSSEGALSDAEAKERWGLLNAFVEDAVLAESARWGDTVDHRNPRTVERDWWNEVRRIESLMVGNGDELLDALKAEGFYPDVDPPFAILEEVGEGVRITFSNPNETGDILYTLDGPDPRVPGGQVHSASVSDGGPFLISQNTLVRARVHLNGQWSALHTETVILNVPALRISEIHFHPGDPNAAELNVGWADANAFEFLELENVGEEAIWLDGFEFVSGIRLLLGDTQLGPGEFGVIVKDQSAFRFRYGDHVQILGEYEGSLDNGGERLRLRGPHGQVIHDFVYEDSWFPSTDGMGYSLVFDDTSRPLSDWAASSSWSASSAEGGSPGAKESSRSEVSLRIERTGNLNLIVVGRANQLLTLLTSTNLVDWSPGQRIQLDASGNGVVDVSTSVSQKALYFRLSQ